MSLFDSPASTTGIDWNATKGHLLLVSPLSLEEKVNTSLGEKDAVRADVVDLDSGETYTDVLVFPRVLIGQLRPRIGGKVLGRLGQGTAKPGQSAPWLLTDFSVEDAKRAERYLAQAPSFAPPAASTPAASTPAADPWVGSTTAAGAPPF